MAMAVPGSLVIDCVVNAAGLVFAGLAAIWAMVQALGVLGGGGDSTHNQRAQHLARLRSRR